MDNSRISKQELIEITTKLKNGEYTEEEEYEIIKYLDRFIDVKLLSDLIFWDKRNWNNERPAEEIVEEVLSVKPIVLHPVKEEGASE